MEKFLAGAWRSSSRTTTHALKARDPVHPAERDPGLRPPFVTAPRGPFRYGDFYEMLFSDYLFESVWKTDFPLPPEFPPIVSPRPSDNHFLPCGAYLEDDDLPDGAPYIACRECGLRAVAGGGGRVARVEFHGGNCLPPFIRLETFDGLVRRPFAERLAATDLRGVRFAPVVMGDMSDWDCLYDAFDDEGRTFEEVIGGEENLLQLEGSVSTARFSGAVEPPELNRCCYCGRRPVKCGRCGHPANPCPDCGRHPIKNVKHATDEERAAGVILHTSAGRPRLLIDPRRWDGSDCFYFGGFLFATRRFVDYLLSIHAWPFTATPIPVLEVGIEAEHLRRLELAHQPVVPKADTDARRSRPPPPPSPDPAADGDRRGYPAVPPPPETADAFHPVFSPLLLLHLLRPARGRARRRRAGRREIGPGGGRG